MTKLPDWYYAEPGTFWLADGSPIKGPSFSRCVLHTLDTANARHNRFQILLQSGSDQADIINPADITEAVPLTLVRKDQLDALVRWRL